MLRKIIYSEFEK